MLNMYNNKGSNLIEYVIPLVLIGLVIGIGLYYMFSKSNLTNFVSRSSDMEYDAVTQSASLGDKSEIKPLLKPNAGDLKGTPDNPVKDCYEGKCTIDYGNIILTGIPEDFHEFVRSAGTSGTSDKIVSLIETIADQLEDSGLENESLEVRKLASIGHNIAAVENTLENNIIKCNGDPDCISEANTGSFPKPEGYDDTFYKFPDNAEYGIYTYYSTTIGAAQKTKTEKPEFFEQAKNKNNLAFLYVDQLDTVLATSGIADNIKGVIKELSWDIGVVGEEFNNNCNYLSSDEEQTYYDPLTGEMVGAPKPDAYSYNSFQNYEASTITHFDSALVCASGNNKDTGTKCH